MTAVQTKESKQFVSGRSYLSDVSACPAHRIFEGAGLKSVWPGHGVA